MTQSETPHPLGMRTTRQNREQQRGQQAWDDIKQIANQKADIQKEYRSLARGLNAMIQINGLGQTLGFLKAKSKSDPNAPKAHAFLLSHLTDWMSEPAHFSTDSTHPIPRNDAQNDLLAWIVSPQTSSADYRRATAECLAFGLWLSRFAEAELEGNE